MLINFYVSNIVTISKAAFILVLVVLCVNCSNGDDNGVVPIGDQPVMQKHISQAAIEKGNIPLSELIDQGSLMFTSQFNTLDGAGRPETTGVGQSPFREARVFPDNFNRISGPDANSCVACHNVPRVGGGGDNVANAFVDAEVFPFANFDGGEGDLLRDITLKTISVERNSIGIFGAGYIELLAREMTFDLLKIRDDAINLAKQKGSDVEVELITKDVHFGKIIARPDGTIDTSFIEGMDDDLLIKPFQQKGVVVSLREFAVKATNNHHGMQATERFRDGVDADGDGMADELTRGDITALVVFMATLPVPGRVMPSHQYARTAAQTGESLFTEIGCVTCHKPYLILDDPVFTEPNPFNPPGKLKLADVSAPLAFDLTEAGPGPHLKKDELGRVMVPVYSDFKRHDMGPLLDTDIVKQQRQIPAAVQGIETELFLTRKLWGVASEPPYLHHGRATLLSEAILMHGGEAEDERIAYEDLSKYEQDSIVEFIKTLQILPEDADTTVIDSLGSAQKINKSSTVTLSVVGGVVGGFFLALTVLVGLLIGRRSFRRS